MLFTVFFAIFAMFQICSFHVSKATEPVCSKFSYEEKLLEKIIRTEIKVETIQNEIKKTDNNVLDTLVEIKKTTSNFYDKYEGLRNNLTGEIATKMKELLNKEENLANKYKELKRNISKDIKNEMDTLAKIKETMLQPTVAFHVHNVKDLILDVKDEVLVFESIITNEGSGYDKSTGIFTASVGGVYYFTVHVCAVYQNHSTIGLVFGGTFISKSINYDTAGYTCGSVGAIVKMASGEKVWVACTHGSISHALTGEDLYRMNTFSGVLINK